MAYIAAFTLYFLILLAIGMISWWRHKIKTDKDFNVGDRSLNYWVTAISAHASDMSSWLFLGFPAAIYSAGLFKAWTAVGLIIGMFLNWQFIAPKIRKATEKYDCYTVSGYFERRFKDTSGIISILTATIAFFFFTVYLSAGLVGMGFLFESVFNVPYITGITIGISVVMIYTFFGGFVTVAWQDMFQGLFLLVMIFIVPIVAFSHIDGIAAITQAAREQAIPLTIVPKSFTKTICEILGWGLGYFGQLHILLRFMGIKHTEELRKAKYLGMIWHILTLTAAIAVGTVGIAYFNGTLGNAELVFIEMVKTSFSPFIVGFVLCAILAATISTMDSQVLVVSAVFTQDVYKKIFHKSATPQQLLIVSRATVIAAGIAAYAIAFGKVETIYNLVKYAWAGVGASFGPVLIMSFYSKSINRNGAIAGIVSGAVIAATWGRINNTIPAMIPAFVISAVAAHIASKVTAKR
ncbi:MAG: sodium/proline symporter [Waddliaceae bacterium]|nr:sodium/proline symporter [Waddliaceae bacterium]MBT7264795.1 sodium/proline symporter [Waddliaceae bacterium]